VLDGVVRAWANCKEGQRPLPSGGSQASCGAGGSMQIGSVGQGHFLTQGYEASELSTLWLSDVKGQPLVDALSVSSLPGPDKEIWKSALDRWRIAL